MKYDAGDMATYYFVINDDGVNKMVQGWTDDKNLAKFYMEFHNCKNFKLKSLTKPIEEISRMLEENVNDEIQIKHIQTRKAGKKHKVEYVPVPVTNTEYSFIVEECKTLMSSMVNYAFISSAIPYLQGKYRDDLKNIMLLDAISVTVHGKRSPVIESIPMDQMMVLLYSFKNNFG